LQPQPVPLEQARLQPQPVPEPEADPCAKCKQAERAKRKKREPRTSCSSGTYRQTVGGLIKRPTKYFDCASGRELPKPVLSKKPKLPRYSKIEQRNRQPGFPGLRRP